MTSDQRRCIQRSRFVCRVLNFCVKKVLLQIHLWELESVEVALPLRGEQRVLRRLCRWNESVQTYGNTKKT